MKLVKFPLRRLALVCAFLSLPVTAGMQQSSTEKVGRYDFAYQVVAHNRVRPVQVFDDGQNTYFQFGAGDAVPAIFRVTDDGPEMAAQSFEGPYLRIDGIAAEYILRLGTASGRVVYTSQGRTNPQLSAPVAQSAPQPAVGGWNRVHVSAPQAMLTPSEARPRAIDTNSYATPAKGDVTKWTSVRVESEEHEVLFGKGISELSKPQVAKFEKLIANLNGDFSVIVIGRDDDSLKENLAEDRANHLAQILVRKGIPKSRIEIKTGPQQKGALSAATQIKIVRTTQNELVQPQRLQAQIPVVPAPVYSEVPAEGFTFLTSDQTISGAVKRWARATSYQLVWELPRDVDPPILRPGRLKAETMKEALEVLEQGMKSKGYAIGITIYKNRVIRISTSI